LYGRNGEAPMVVIAASTPSDCFHYAFWAAKIALERMTPVILLTDGFIANGSEPWRIPSMSDYPAIEAPIVGRMEGDCYYTYDRDPESGARTWAIPGTPGLEHRIGGLEKHKRTGAVSHDPANHQAMTEARAEKVARVVDLIPVQEVVGEPEGDLLVVGWGGTRGHLQSAVEKMRAAGKRVSLCHFNWIDPLPRGCDEIFARFKRIVVCELNMGQFASYLRMNFPRHRFEQYNKVQGLPFTVDELTHHFEELLK
jgi:2-oxoglutarate ferredoxin oxidoreductase subunit alpha